MPRRIPTPNRRSFLKGALALGIGLEATARLTGTAFAAKAGSDAYMFAAGRLRTPTTLGEIKAGREYTAHKIEFVSPDYPTNSFRVAFPGHSTAGKAPSEMDADNPYIVEAFTLQAFIGKQWQVVQGTINGQPSGTIEPGAGSLSDDIVFQDSIPRNTRMAFAVAIQTKLGGTLPISLKNRSGTLEGAVGSATKSQVAAVAEGGQMKGKDGRISGRVFAPSFIVAKAPEGLDRPVFWINGDSIGWGKNSDENVLTGPEYHDGTGAIGFLGIAMEDSARSRRLSYYNSCVPGVGVGEQQDRTLWSRKLDLIRQVPNRPYTHIITQHNNNGPSGDYLEIFKPAFLRYYELLATESASWGDAPAPIYQTRPIPRSGIWPYSLEAQSPSTAPLESSVRWQFDADLVAGDVFTGLAGVIDINKYYAFDQGKNRDKISVPKFGSRMAIACSPKDRAIILEDKPEVGDFLLLAPGPDGQGRYVTEVTGAGPFKVMLASVVDRKLAAGTKVQAVLAADRMGLHPATAGHELLAKPVIEWKNALFG